ncbi:uncharacterized protein LOC110828330 [Zootermopsis nevadensis]|uniref:uncharacterized protein LOC110828330 n=1 Tax=Zootermopsis nevadensis TaxID=136037 RepID=UPI000B8E54E2|nr:uncharacterized protein LOC110828330 [Zootermopsis nevadensis]XP_021916641.1 uncharacterized protein LOC110828330 [Zootermopsis nevadensis]
MRQGCSLSPVLFSGYIHRGLDEVREKLEGVRRVCIQGEKVDMLRFADDIAVLAENLQDLVATLAEMESTLSTTYNLNINKEKTKILVVSKHGMQAHCSLGSERLENMESFTYLGCRLSSDERSKAEVISRINQAKLAFNKKHNLFTSNSIDKHLRKHLVKTFVWIVLLYGSETWTIGEAEKKRIVAFEPWCYRRILKMPWVDRVSNKEVLLRIEEEKLCLWDTLQKRRNIWVGHIIRLLGLIKMILEGAVEGKNSRGRPRLTYINQLTEDTGCPSYTALKRLAEDREAWRAAASQSYK